MMCCLSRNNELLQGVVDKNQYGASAYGVVHAVYELHGATVAGNLLTALGRLYVGCESPRDVIRVCLFVSSRCIATREVVVVISFSVRW
jgi:hypothetical protein